VKVFVAKTEGFDYGQEFVWYGQLLDLKGLPGDDDLMKIGYLRVFRADDPQFEVVRSPHGREFVSEGALRTHLAKIAESKEYERRATYEDPSVIQLPTDNDIMRGQLNMGGVRDVSVAQGTPLPADAGQIKKKQCPICSHYFAPQGMRMHVSSCEALKGTTRADVAAKGGTRGRRKVAAVSR
jgi:hypothetical protein